MATWNDVVVADSAFADRVRRTFAVRKHATLATLRRDGAPRISGTEVEFDDDGVHLGMMRGSLKALDLRRDPRVAVHSPTVDPPDDDPTRWLGDGKLAAVAVEVSGPDDEAHRFRLDLTEVALTTVGGDHLVIVSWHPGRGVTRRTRR